MYYLPEEHCFTQIVQHLEKLCGLGNDKLDDFENWLWNPAAVNAISGYYKGIECNYPNYCDDLDTNNKNMHCFTRYERESLYNQKKKYRWVSKQSPLRQQDPVHSTSQHDYDQRPTSMLNMVKSDLPGFCAKQKRVYFEGKRNLCRHFLKGQCNRGNSCDFLHDESIFCSDEQKVFLGGLPTYITVKVLRDNLRTAGYTVLNQPKVLHGFSPQICLGSVQEAQNMIKRGKVMIEGTLVDVRPYQAFRKDNLKMYSEVVKRSIFLRGLSRSTTCWMIKKRLADLGFVTVNYPNIKGGFASHVMLESAKQAQRLLKLKNIKINKSIVEIRPYPRDRVKHRKI